MKVKNMIRQWSPKRGMLLVLPILALPFLALLFWALGGGKQAYADTVDNVTGLNLQLPDAHEQQQVDKLGIYQQAEKDSSQLLEAMRNDPYYQQLLADSAAAPQDLNTYPQDAAAGQGALIALRLKELSGGTQPDYQPAGSTPRGDPVSAMMAALQTPESADPEMQQLDGMLDKILDIQNPHRAQQRLQTASAKNRKQVFTIEEPAADNTVELLAAPNPKKRKAAPPNTFHEWSDSKAATETGIRSVAAVVQETRTVTAGATIKMRLQDPVFISGIKIPAGQFIYGQCSFSEDRLVITIPSIRYLQGIYPVSLLAYDMDGLAGIYIPGAMGRDAAKNAAGDAAQGLDIYSMDNNLTTQAASVGVSAAKSLLSKKARQLKVTVKAGYRLLLKDSNANE